MELSINASSGTISAQDRLSALDLMRCRISLMAILHSQV
jgi:hypothetical protein